MLIQKELRPISMSVKFYAMQSYTKYIKSSNVDME